MATPLKQLPQFIETEPVATLAGALSIVFNSTLVTVTGLDIVDLSWEQMIMLAMWFNGLLAFFTVWQRSKVTPVEKANNRIEKAAAMPAGSEPPLID